MTAEQLRQYINQLASSGREQSAGGNFGVGAKVAAGSRNPHGLEYRSWHRGQGALVCFKRHPDGRWGLEPQRWPDGRSDFWRPLDEQDKPWLLRGQDHGTQVVLLGRHERHDTTQPPGSVSDGSPALDHPLPQRPLPATPRPGRGARPRAARPRPARTATAHPRRAAPPPAARDRGGCRCELSDAIAHWWVLDDDHRARRREGALWASTGHAAAVVRRRALRHPAADPRRVRAPSGLRHPLRLRKGRTTPRTAGRRPAACSATPPERCCCSTTSRCHGLAGVRSSPPRCPPRSCGSRNAPPALTACLARRRSATASVRSCRCTN